MKKNYLRHLVTGTLLLVISGGAQTLFGYPSIPEDVRQESAEMKERARAHSDQKWEEALPIIKKWEQKGKPYIPKAEHPEDLPQADIPAFPGAQGGGMYSHGGRGGEVYVVTNLNDSGPGSFREACEAGGPRIVVFNVAGIIELETPLYIRAPYITISGATAPGDGVCIAGETVEVETHDVIIRHMRFRRGSTWVGSRNDALGGNPIGNIMIDHVSTSWGLDENMSFYRHMYQPEDGGDREKLPTVNLTIQNSISSEALDTFDHAYGSTIGGYNATFHHNLWASNAGRNPSVGMIYDFTMVNNVIFNWYHRTVDGGDHRSYYTIYNNYFKPGPVTPKGERISHRILKAEARRSQHFNTDFGRAYVSGNVVHGNEEVTRNNWDGGVQVDDNDRYDPEKILSEIRIDKPYPHAYLEVESAEEAYKTVLANVGATRPVRDPVDERIVREVKTGKVTYAEGRGILTGIEQVGGYPEYKGEPYTDSDDDGMPDKWEEKHGLDPNDPSDAMEDSNGDGYVNIEELINGRDPNAPAQEWETPRTWRDLFWNL